MLRRKFANGRGGTLTHPQSPLLTSGLVYSNHVTRGWRAPLFGPVAAALSIAALHAAGAPSEYVDSKLCARCHRTIAEDFARTGMGRSFLRPSDSRAIEELPAGGIREFYHDRSDT